MYTVTSAGRVALTGYEGSPTFLAVPGFVYDGKMRFAVTSIGDKAFYGCSTLTYADLGDARVVGLKAFANCSSLEELHLTAFKIKGWAFFGCSSLRKADLSSVMYVGEKSFRGCPLESVVFSGSLAYLPDGAFPAEFIGTSGEILRAAPKILAGHTFEGLGGKLRLVS